MTTDQHQAPEAMTDEQIRDLWFAATPTPDGRPASWNYARSLLAARDAMWSERLRPQAVPMTDEPQSAPKLIGWRTENFLWETDDVDKARNWEPNIGVLPIFEGDPNTKLGSRGITAQGAQGEQG